MIIKEFGGLPWNLLFKKKPQFSKDGKVFNCRLEEREGLPYVEGGRYVLCIDDVEIRSEQRFREDEFEADTNAITDYLQEKKALLSQYWFNELEKEQNKGGAYYSEFEAYIENDSRKSILTLMAFLNDDYKASNEDEHRALVNSYKGLLTEMRMKAKYDYYEPMEFYTFFVNEDVLEPIDDTGERYRLLNNYTPEEFIFMARFADSLNLIDRLPSPTEFYPHICKADSLEAYKKTTWQKTRKGKPLRKKQGRMNKKPKFIIVHSEEYKQFCKEQRG